MQTKTIYLLHGWAISAVNESKWQQLRTFLKKQGIDTIFLALPGLSSPLDRPWTLQSYVEWLAEQLPKEEKVVLLGHSFGGQLATRFAAQYPKRLSKLILIASAGIRDYSFFAVAKRSVFYTLAKVGGFAKNNHTLKSLLYKLAREQDYNQADEIMKKTMASVLSDEVKKDIPNVTCETLLIWGKRDKSTPYTNTRFFLQIPRSKLVTMPDARHSPQFTHAAEVAENIATFVKPSGKKELNA